MQEKSCCNENKDLILDAAARLFSQKGYAGTSIREIVEAAGITKPTLYYYFRNKEELYIELMETAVATFDSVLQEGLSETADIAAPDRFIYIFQRIHALFEGNVEVVRLINSLIWHSVSSAPHVDFIDRHREAEVMFRHILEEGARRGEVAAERIPELLLLLLGFLHSMLVIVVLRPQDIDLNDDVIARVVRTLWAGAVREPETSTFAGENE
ncbi:MAG: TetR/AcrR family transcriptional regulator [Thermodesulfobacteriota bacterium]